jgi:hypothetical protein
LVPTLSVIIIVVTWTIATGTLLVTAIALSVITVVTRTITALLTITAALRTLTATALLVSAS